MTTALTTTSSRPERPDTKLWPIEGEPDSCDVAVAVSNVVFIFRISRLFLHRGRLESLTAVDWEPADVNVQRGSMPMPQYGFSPTGLDWRSNSSMDTYKRNLQQYFEPGKTAKDVEFPWTQILQAAAARVNEFIKQVGQLQAPDWIQQVKQEYMVKPLWPMRKRATVWYGQGETGKGQMAVGVATAICYGFNLANLACKTASKGIVYVDYEDDFEEFSVRVSRISNAMGVPPPGNLLRFDPRGRLFVDIAEQLKAMIATNGGTDGIIVDSAIPAVGGDALESSPVGAFFNALSWLDVPPLIIAHETKAGNDDFPFGSQLWRTESAMTVNFQASGEVRRTLDGHYVRDVLLRCTKANNGPRFTPLAFQLEFSDDDASNEAQGALLERPLASTWVRQMDPTKVSADLQAKLPPIRRLVAVLRDVPEELTAKEIAELAGMEMKTVQNTLDRNREVFASDGGGRGRGNAAKWRVIQGGKA